jgi:hypothetical protein
MALKQDIAARIEFESKIRDGLQRAEMDIRSVMDHMVTDNLEADEEELQIAAQELSEAAIGMDHAPVGLKPAELTEFQARVTALNVAAGTRLLSIVRMKQSTTAKTTFIDELLVTVTTELASTPLLSSLWLKLLIRRAYLASVDHQDDEAYVQVMDNILDVYALSQSLSLTREIHHWLRGQAAAQRTAATVTATPAVGVRTSATRG